VLETRIQLSNDDQTALEAVGNHLQEELAVSKGVTGFCELKLLFYVMQLLMIAAHGLLPDADDTAKSVHTLQLLGRNPDVRPIVDNFQAPTVFVTYAGERTPSISTNCNVLKALLTASALQKCKESICITVDFICRSWFSGRFTDKWVRTCHQFQAISLIW
jgi:hypothetical protein